jgi:hypothetical protein
MESKLVIPPRLPAYIEIEGGAFISAELATVAQWQAENARAGDRSVKQLVSNARELGIPDDVALLPRLRTLAKPNVVSVPPKRPRR